ncbi:MAG: DJ-1/PfpI family protein [Phycisphaerae bacterium]
MNIGALIFPGIDQLDFTGPFKVLSRLPGAEVHILWKTLEPVRDIHGLILTPTLRLADCPPLEALVIPGGPGQEEIMEDQEIIDFIRDRAKRVKIVLSVCTGALLCGAAGLLAGKAATMHWASLNLLHFFGAKPQQDRVVISGNLITCAGVTSGIDGALAAAAKLVGEKTAKLIQLAVEYAPEPPFDCGDIRTAPRSISVPVRQQFARISVKRLRTARRIARLKHYSMT